MRRASISVLALTALLLLAATAGAADDGVVVKFELLKSGHICVPVKINGKGPFRLGFDTGSPMTFVSTTVAKQLALRGTPARQMGAGTMPGTPAPVDTFEVGDFKVTNFSVSILDHPTVQQISRAEGGLEGLVGFTFFTRYDVTIDYEKKEMTFRPRGTRLASTYRKPTGRAALVGAAFDASAAGELVITEVAPGTPAEQGGLKVGDTVCTVNGRCFMGARGLTDALGSLAPGLPARLKVSRNSRELELTVTPRPGL